MFKTKLINKFYEALFSTDFNDYETATQNAKTDNLFDCKDFNEWLVMLIKTFAREFELATELIIIDVYSDSEFIKSMKAEYEELKELCADDE